MDLALNNLQSLICHIPPPKKKTSKFIYYSTFCKFFPPVFASGSFLGVYVTASRLRSAKLKTLSIVADFNSTLICALKSFS